MQHVAELFLSGCRELILFSELFVSQQSIAGRSVVERPESSEKNSLVRPLRGKGCAPQSLFLSSRGRQCVSEDAPRRGTNGGSLTGEQSLGTEAHDGAQGLAPAAPQGRTETSSLVLGGRRTQAEEGMILEESMAEDDEEDDLFLSSLGRATVRKSGFLVGSIMLLGMWLVGIA